jgi:hypothetical protein
MNMEYKKGKIKKKTVFLLGVFLMSIPLSISFLEASGFENLYPTISIAIFYSILLNVVLYILNVLLK